ncbi:MAG: hypothetical protein K6A80_00785 [Saccharofermentans sp.]|nr:hypothetical protein [Saccharofermentans sp.]
MLLFSTILDIESKMTREAFMELVMEWNNNPRYYEVNRIPDLVWKGEKSIRFGNDNLWLAAEEYSKESTIAVRFEKVDNGITWDTDYVMNFRNMKMAVMLDRSYSPDALIFDGKYSTPAFISFLIKHGYLKKDGDIPFTENAIVMTDDKIGLIADIMNGRNTYKVPVVYVSKTDDNENPIDVDRLAYRLKGVAHVFVQESIDQEQTITDAVVIDHVSSGSIAIYYPNDAVSGGKIIRRREEDEDYMLSYRTVQEVLKYINLQTVKPLFTWQGINNALLMDRVDSQREAVAASEAARKKLEEEASRIRETLDEETRKIYEQAVKTATDEANELLEAYDEDMERMKKQIADLTKANETLISENQGLRSRCSSFENTPVITFGIETDFYDGEIKDLVLSALEEALKNVPEDSRRHDVFSDIIENNNYEKSSKMREEEIRRLLGTYDGLPAKLKQDLMSLGMVITDDGKHYKMSYYGDGRYTVAMSKTPSDWRAGKNLVSEVVGKMV